MPTPLDAMLAINGVSQVPDGIVLVPKEAIVEEQMAHLKKESTNLGRKADGKMKPMTLSMAPKRKLELTPPTTKHVISRATDLPLRKNVPWRLNFDHDQGGLMHQNTNEKARDQVAGRSARGAYFANPRPKQPTPHPMAPPTSKMAPSDPHVLEKPVKFPTKPRSMRSRGELRPWLGERKDKFRAKAINKKVQPRQSHVVRNFQPRTVRPAYGALIRTWQRLEHPKFPNPPLQHNRKTWRQRELRRRAKARKEMERNEEVENLNSTFQRCNFFGMEQVKLDARTTMIKKRKAELQARSDVLANMVIALSEVQNESLGLSNQKNAKIDDDTNDGSSINDDEVDVVINSVDASENEIMQANDFDEKSECSIALGQFMVIETEKEHANLPETQQGAIMACIQAMMHDLKTMVGLRAAMVHDLKTDHAANLAMMQVLKQI
ncbi:hypothetical protein COLO4_05026 [Corchorus olitorius]|uniref:Uncharacterized protein n=1 Tax=Corchorus olitorius TaxID=93759 RepID=A0A1R3KS75_9ROSI|nr:hypothetical protein COLO4_05026 [Corchorus olitorius]